MILLALVALATCVAALWLWPRLARRGARHVVGRVVLLGAAQIMVLATVAAVTNKYFEFYSSWGDLLGGGSTSFSVADYGSGESVNSAEHLTDIRVSRVVATQPASRGGELVTASLHGAVSGVVAPIRVYLPPQYFQRAYARRRLPAAVVLAAAPAAVLSLSDLSGAMNRGELRPLVVVETTPTVDHVDCLDVPSSTEAQEFLAQDVPAAVDGSYRVVDHASGWGTVGDPSGSYCALKLAMTNSDQFGAAAVTAPDFGAPTAGDALYGNSPLIRDENDLEWRLRHLPAPPISVLFGFGSTSSGAATSFASLVRPPMSLTGPGVGTACAGGVTALLSWLSAELAAGPAGGTHSRPPLPGRCPGVVPATRAATAGTGGR